MPPQMTRKVPTDMATSACSNSRGRLNRRAIAPAIRSVPVVLAQHMPQSFTAILAQHIARDGIIAIHISNRFLDLKPVLANIADSLGLDARHVSDSPSGGGSASITDWVLITRTDAPFAHELLADAAPLEPNPSFSLWTDQFNNLLDVLKSSPLREFRRLAGFE